MSAGSGIPEVKSFLNGVRVRNVINVKTFLGKWISIIFAFSSCLHIGPEGPMFHIGAIIGGGIAATKSKTLHLRFHRVFELLRDDAEIRDFTACGAAAGIAAGFGAPIGAVLMAMEEASYWSKSLSIRATFGNDDAMHSSNQHLTVCISFCHFFRLVSMVAVFTVNLLLKPSWLLNADYGMIAFGFSSSYLYRYYELFAFAWIGILGGLLGALFVSLNQRLNQWRRDVMKGSKIYAFFEVKEKTKKQTKMKKESSLL
jgi:H+/Cl- antiporter ClcA